jgi:FdhD protein
VKPSLEVNEGAAEQDWLEYQRGWTRARGEVIGEALLGVYVNGREIASIMCTPVDQVAFVLGFLKNEGLLDRMEQVSTLTVSQNGCCVDVWLDHAVRRPRHKVLTSGCGGGITFRDPAESLPPVEADVRLAPEALIDLMDRLHTPDSLHARARGVHTSALTDAQEILFVAEDVGRHNTIDRLAGMAMLAEMPTRGRILLTTGRVSSEMLRKAARMGCPIIASRNSPTSLAVSLAQAWNITLAAYVRRSTLRAYAHAERLGWQDAAG